MLQRLLQAATITFLLNLLAYLSSPDVIPIAISPSLEIPKLVVSLQ